MLERLPSTGVLIFYNGGSSASSLSFLNTFGMIDSVALGLVLAHMWLGVPTFSVSPPACQPVR